MSDTARSRWLGAVLVALATASAAAYTSDDEIAHLVDKMSIDEKVGQMTQIDISMIVGPDRALDKDKLRHWLEKYKVGSFLNSPFAARDCNDGGPTGWTAAEWRAIVSQVQEEAQRLGLPPIIFGIDSIHGATYVRGATLFGQQIALAATFDRGLAQSVGAVTGRDTIAAGIPWLFSPVLGIATQPAWARVYETFGEDPFVAAELGASLIKGIQADSGDAQLPRAAACMKHYLAYSHPESGQDRAPTFLPEQQIIDQYLRPFAAAVDAGVASAMTSYNEVNGMPITASRKWTRNVLRGKLGFKGLVVTDWAEIVNLETFHKLAPDRETAVFIAMNRTSIDMSMVPMDASFSESLARLVRTGALPQARLDESVARVLALKKWLGLLHAPVPDLSSPLMDKVGTDEDLAVRTARASVTLLMNRREFIPTPGRACGAVQAGADATRGSDIRTVTKAEAPDAEACRTACRMEPACQVWLFMGSWAEDHPDWGPCFLKDARASVLEDEGHAEDAAGSCEASDRAPGVLPLDTSTLGRVLVTGPGADSLTYQSGGWSIRWQGACADSDFAGGESIKQGLRRLLPSSVHLDSTRGCVIDAPSHSTARCDPAEEEETLDAARAADAVVVVIGEENYTEKPGDIVDLGLIDGQVSLVQRIAAAAPNVPIVLVLVEGRPRLLRGLTRTPQVKAVVHAYLPGPHGGGAVAEVLLGITNPSGRLPLTYPSEPNAIHQHYHPVSAECAGASVFLSATVDECPVEFPFGRGLSYTSFNYSALRTTTAGHVAHPGVVGVSLNVTNTGSRAGRHSVLLFVSQAFRVGRTPERQRLVGFGQVHLAPGETGALELSVRTQQLAFTNEFLETVVESGDYRLFAAPGDPLEAKREVTLTVVATDAGASPYRDILQRTYERTAGNGAQWAIVMVTAASIALACFAVGTCATLLILRALHRRAAVGKGAYATVFDEVALGRGATPNPMRLNSRLNSVNDLTRLDRIGGDAGHSSSWHGHEQGGVCLDAQHNACAGAAPSARHGDDDETELSDIRLHR